MTPSLPFLQRSSIGPRRDVTIVSGHASRDKRVAIAGLTESQFAERLNAILRRVIAADLLIAHARQIILYDGKPPFRGSAQGKIEILRDGAIAAQQGRSSMSDHPSIFTVRSQPLPGASVVDARDLSIVPGFVDAHTHAAFAGDRREELRRRLAGATYADIAAAGGGIVSTVAATRAASQAELVDQNRARVSTKCSRAGRRLARSRADTV